MQSKKNAIHCTLPTLDLVLLSSFIACGHATGGQESPGPTAKTLKDFEYDTGQGPLESQ
jgi:hypothetical protein